METIWPYLTLAGLGAFHGLNPAMGWLFAVALGLHRNGRVSVLKALPPIAIGHALSVAAVAALFLSAGVLVEQRTVQIAAGAVLIVWAVYHQVYGHRRRVRVGMTAGFLGLLLWSFTMATAHGAGLMVLPVIMPLCLPASPLTEATASQASSVAIGAVAVHSGAMLAVTGLVALLVHDWLGLSLLRKGWVNLDLVWTLALAATGAALLLLATWPGA